MITTIELEAERAVLAREILNVTDENTIHNLWLILKNYKSDVSQRAIPEKRPLGILNGKARIVFKDDFEMTTEELLELQ